VVKIRASAHSSALHLFHIDDDGIKIDEMLVGYEGLLGGRPTRSHSLLNGPASGADDG